MKIKCLTSSLAVASAMLCGAAQAQVINFDAPGAFGTDYSGQGAYSDPGNNYWNAFPAAGNTTPLGFDSSGGFATAIANVTLTLSGNINEGYNNGGDGGTDPAIGGLMAPWVLIGGGATATGTLNDIPNGVYDLYLYGMNYPDQDRGVSFTVNGITQSTLGINYNQPNHTSALNSFVQAGAFDNATITGGVGTLPGDAAPANYVVYANLVVTDGTIAFSFTGNPLNRAAELGDFSGNNGEGDFNGLQLVVVPEPSTMAIFALGFCSLIFMIRRQKSLVN